MRWNAIFNTHFSVLVNFVLFVYLDVYLQLNFVSMNICNICHFFQLFCHIIVIVLRHILKAIRKFNRLSRQFFIYFFFIYLFLFLSIQSHPSAFQKKCCLNFWSTYPLAFQNIVLMKIWGNFPLKHQFWSPLFEDIWRPSRFVKDYLP